MAKEKSKLLAKLDDREKILNVASFISSAVPWIGGPVSNVLGGISTSRKIARVDELLKGMAEELKDFKSEISENYVKTEDFEDLLDQTLRRTSEERNEEKRKIFKSFLVQVVKNPGEQYDDQLRLLRLMDNIYADHILVLKALMAEPKGSSDRKIHTLVERLPGMSSEKIKELVTQLNNLRVTDLQALTAMMTTNAAQDLRNSVTPTGQRLIKYLIEA